MCLASPSPWAIACGVSSSSYCFLVVFQTQVRARWKRLSPLMQFARSNQTRRLLGLAATPLNNAFAKTMTSPALLKPAYSFS